MEWRLRNMESLSAAAAALAAPASSAAERAAAERVFLGLKEVGFAGFRCSAAAPTFLENGRRH